MRYAQLVVGPAGSGKVNILHYGIVFDKNILYFIIVKLSMKYFLFFTEKEFYHVIIEFIKIINNMPLT